MLGIFDAYEKYPFKVPARVRFFNLFRYFFKIPILEGFLISRLKRGQIWWRRLVPPLYFYKQGSIRIAERDKLIYRLDISRLLDHSIYFCKVKDSAWDTLFTYLKRDFVVLDIGANIGFLTINFARACPEGFVFSFEPDSQNFSDLQNNIRLNNFNNIRAFQKALGEKHGNAVLYKIYANNPGANRILSNKPAYPHQLENVEVSTIDEIEEITAMKRVDLMKIDVEGFEMFVLQGAQKLIERWKPILFVELVEMNLNQHGYSALSLIEYIENMGYEVKDARTVKDIDRAKQDHHTDILCFYKSGR